MGYMVYSLPCNVNANNHMIHKILGLTGKRGQYLDSLYPPVNSALQKTDSIMESLPFICG